MRLLLEVLWNKWPNSVFCSLPATPISLSTYGLRSVKSYMYLVYCVCFVYLSITSLNRHPFVTNKFIFLSGLNIFYHHVTHIPRGIRSSATIIVPYSQVCQRSQRSKNIKINWNECKNAYRIGIYFGTAMTKTSIPPFLNIFLWSSPNVLMSESP